MRLPTKAAAVVAEHVGTLGARGVETGGFLLGRDDSVSVVALAGHVGVRRERDLFVVAGAACGRLFEHADASGLALLCQWHSHRGRAELSLADVAYGFNVPGLHSMIVPGYASVLGDPSDWGWWRFDGGGWVGTHVEMTTGGCSTIIFDAGGVRAT